MTNYNSNNRALYDVPRCHDDDRVTVLFMFMNTIPARGNSATRTGENRRRHRADELLTDKRRMYGRADMSLGGLDLHFIALRIDLSLSSSTYATRTHHLS